MCSSIILASCAAVATKNVDDPGKPLVVHAASSTTYRMTNLEGYVTAQTFIKRHPPPFSFLPTGPPDPPKLDKLLNKRRKFAIALTGIKVKTACTIMKILGQKRVAKKLEVSSSFVQSMILIHASPS